MRVYWLAMTPFKIHLRRFNGTVEMDTLKQKERVFETHEKSKGIAYLLWLLFGWLGVHRFYAGKTGSGLVRLLLAISVVGLPIAIMLWLIDAFLIPDMINEYNLGVIDMIYGPQEPLGVSEDPVPEPQLANETDERRQAMLDDLRQTGYRKTRLDDVSRIYR